MILFSVGNYYYGKLKAVVPILIFGDPRAVGLFQVRMGEQGALLEIDSKLLGLRGWPILKLFVDTDQYFDNLREI